MTGAAARGPEGPGLLPPLEVPFLNVLVAVAWALVEEGRTSWGSVIRVWWAGDRAISP